MEDRVSIRVEKVRNSTMVYLVDSPYREKLLGDSKRSALMRLENELRTRLKETDNHYRYWTYGRSFSRLKELSKDVVKAFKLK